MEGGELSSVVVSGLITLVEEIIPLHMPVEVSRGKRAKGREFGWVDVLLLSLSSYKKPGELPLEHMRGGFPAPPLGRSDHVES